MKNKGFTLVELLVVMVIIGIVTTMSWPAITRIQEMNTMSKYESYGDAMVAAAKVYVDAYEEDMFYYEDDLTEEQKEAGQCYYIMLQELIEHSYIKDFNQKGMTCLSDSSFVRVSRKKGKYKYKYYLGCGNKKEINPDTKKLSDDHVYFTLPTQNTLNVADNDSCSASLAEFKITYNSAGGSSCSPTSSYYVEGANMVWGPLCRPTREYYHFLGWFDADGNEIKEDSVVTGSITATAHWRKNQVQIIYKPNGGHLLPEHDAQFTELNGTILRNGTEVAETVSYDTILGTDGLWNYNCTTWINIGKEGYHANSGSAWNTEPDGSGTSYSQITRYPATDFCDAKNNDCTVILYVNWVTNYIYIHQHANGGELTTPRHSGVGMQEDGLCTYNGSLNFRSIKWGETTDPWNWNNPDWLNLKRDGYICKLHEEWYLTKEDGTIVTFNHASNYDFSPYCDPYKNCTLTLYANWIPA